MKTKTETGKQAIRKLGKRLYNYEDELANPSYACTFKETETTNYFYTQGRAIVTNAGFDTVEAKRSVKNFKEKTYTEEDYCFSSDVEPNGLQFPNPYMVYTETDRIKDLWIETPKELWDLLKPFRQNKEKPNKETPLLAFYPQWVIVTDSDYRQSNNAGMKLAYGELNNITQLSTCLFNVNYLQRIKPKRIAVLEDKLYFEGSYDANTYVQGIVMGIQCENKTESIEGREKY